MRCPLAHDGRAFADAASHSAALNQQYVPNEWYDEVVDEFDAYAADGICVAHTGTMLGLIFLLPADNLSSIGETNMVLRRARGAKRKLEQVVGSSAVVELVMTPHSPDAVE